LVDGFDDDKSLIQKLFNYTSIYAKIVRNASPLS